ALAGLRPVALLELLGDEAMRGGQPGELELGELGLTPGRPEVGPDELAPLPDRVRGDTHAVSERTLGRHARHVHAAAGHVELPAVIGAAQPALLDRKSVV